MKDKWKFLRYQNLSEELKKYGYHFTLKHTVRWYMLAILAVVGISLLYKLNVAYMLILIAEVSLLFPGFLLIRVKEKYQAYLFTLANDYMEQFLHIFRHNGTVLQTLMDIYEIMDVSTLREVIVAGIDHTVNATDSDDSEAEGLELISEFFHCDKVDLIHHFVLGAQRRGGDVSGSIRLLEQSRLMWVKRVEGLQKEFRVVKRDMSISLMATLAICLFPLYLLGEKFDISGMLICQVTALILIMLCILLYVRMSKKLCRNWLESSEKTAGMKQKYLETEAYEEKKKTHNIGYRLARKQLNREIVKAFPEWLMQVALLLQTNNVQMAIRLSVVDAPEVLVPAIERLVSELEQHPNDVTPYHNFLKSYPNPDIRSVMQNLYALSNGNVSNIDMQIQELIEKNNLMADKTKQLHQEDMLAGMKLYTLAPTLLASFKLMIDMALLLLTFLQELKF